MDLKVFWYAASCFLHGSLLYLKQRNYLKYSTDIDFSWYHNHDVATLAMLHTTFRWHHESLLLELCHLPQQFDLNAAT